MRAGALVLPLGSLCFLVAIAGCGGGNASSSIPVTVSTAAASSPAPLPSSNGDELVYSGTLTQTFQNFPEVVPPGSPSPEPTSVTTENVTQQITVLSNQAFNGGTGLTDLHSVETDAQASGLKTTTSTTDTYETTAQAGSTSQLLDYGSQFADEAGDTMTTSYQPQRIDDELPETAGATWTNGAGAQVDQALAGDASGSAITVAQTINPNGTYSEATTYPPNYSAPGFTGVGQIQENADGSGTFAFVANDAALTIEYSEPVPQATGSPLITIAEFGGLDPTAADQPNASFTLSDWYGSAPAFYSEADRDLGTVTVPSSCALSSSFPQSAAAIQETITRTDTILGYTEQEVQTSYVSSGVGPLCTVLQDTQTLFYDFNGDQAAVFTATPPLEIASVAETLALQPASASTSTATAKTRAKSTSISSLSHTQFDVAPALRVRFDRAVEIARRRIVNALARRANSIRTAHAQGVKR
jgi:hypothetical protein